LVNKVTREVSAPSARDLNGWSSQMLEEQPTQVTSTQTNAIGKCVNIANIERTLGDQFRRARDHR